MGKIFVDLEIIASNNENSLENAIEKVEFRASKKYYENINRARSNFNISEEEYRPLIEEFYDLKDRVLEEVDDKYKNKIDFKKIYEVNDENQVMYEFINTLSNGYEVYIIFYYNTLREKNEKEEICKKYFPNFELIPIKFYQEPYSEEYLRKRTNKALYVKNYLNLDDLSGCILYDKSIISCNEWDMLSGISQLQTSNKSKGRVYQK